MNGSGRRETWEGTIHKCPHCGEPVESFSGYCPACGHELRDRNPVQSASELAEKLARLEERKASIPRKWGPFSQIGFLNQISEINQQKANCIKAHPIPNNVEDIKEFVTLAATNVDFESYSSFLTRRNAELGREISDAWLSKCDQAMQKAHALMSGRPEVDELQSVVNSVKKRVKRAKISGVAKCIALCAGPIIFFFALFGILALSGVIGPEAAEREQSRLEGIEASVQEDLRDGEYLRALLRADSIETDISEEMSQEWAISREYWMDRVVREAGENGVDLTERAEQLEAERLTEGESSSETDSDKAEEESSLETGLGKAKENIDEFISIMAGENEASQE